MKQKRKPTNPVKDMKKNQNEWRYIACSCWEDGYCKGMSFLPTYL